MFASNFRETIVLPRAKSNRIEIDSQPYHYIVSESADTHADIVVLTLTMQHRVENGAILRVVGLHTCRVPEAESKFYMGRTVTHSLEPRHVAQLARFAIAHGWIPTDSGPPFVLQVTNADIFSDDNQK